MMKPYEGTEAYKAGFEDGRKLGWFRHYSDGYEDGYKAGKPRWIPCSERLPNARQSVIISTNEGFAGEGCYWETTEHHVIWKGYRWNATYWDDEVTAWMPLPEPYQEVE